ncbi:hypothetical protein OBBRIDRAFT_840009 [Obba rivulosa]|uniref:Uncharacterized protein n=1 Tax=Obba rivulosa TaxID=1052685 RepID=A0A8E2AH23_9APHY|nr:hypothetical protein OBBRIDRAFT_840009 [Obba rivulosa]
MFAAFSTLAVFVPFVSALTLQTPTNWESGTNANVSWTNAAGDPSTWSLELVNPTNFHNSFAIANNVNPAPGFITVQLPIVPAGSGYVLEAVGISNISDVISQTGEFSIAQTPSTVFSSMASSALSSGASTASLSSGAAASSGFGSIISGASHTVSAAATSGGSAAASHSSAPATTGTSSFNGAIQFGSGIVSWAVMALTAVAGAVITDVDTLHPATLVGRCSPRPSTILMPQSTTSDRSSRVSRSSAVSTPAWPPPRAPLAPHRLAKLANALGVSTPLPAIHTYAPPLSTSPPLPNSSASSSFPDHFRRSPTPSVASAQTYSFSAAPSSTRYLLHVVPPAHLPHESDSEDSDLTSAPLTASGYHPQFRRGVLVPVCSSLPTQLSVIAKEYALPSTVGMVLYLISTSADAKSPTEERPEFEEPGPRISDDIWRHIWLRVLKSEREDSVAGLRPIGLGLGVGPQPSNFLQDAAPGALRSLISPKRIESPQPQMTPSPSTPSPSVFSHQSDADPPDSMSSVPGDQDGEDDDIPLPGLNSPSLIPVLAKVEFDIDRRKAQWYESWLRSRRVNLAKRTESRLGMRKRSGSRVEGDIEEEGEDEKKAPIDLKLVERMRAASPAPSFLSTLPGAEAEGEYAQLEDSMEPGVNADEADDEDVTARLNRRNSADPLADVFGTDEETWADVHVQSGAKRETNPNVVPLALDGAALSELPDTEEDVEQEDNDVEEVTQLLTRQSRPPLEVTIPSSPPSASKRRSSPTTAGTVRKPPPPPLNLVPALPGSSLSVEDPSPHSVVNDVHDGDEPLDDDDDDDDASVYEDEIEIEETPAARKARSPQDEKREGAIFEDLDLGLGDQALEYDEDDPHDQRRSQVLMRQQLDEIERTLVQFSPRRLRTEELTDEDVLLPLPHQSTPPRSHDELPSADRQVLSMLQGASWPAVPYSALNKRDTPNLTQSGADDYPPSPPRIAFNGISTDLPKALLQPRMSSSAVISDETLARKRALEEHDGLYPPLVAPASFQSGGQGESPIIPLSPDPFGRFPSIAEDRQSDDFEDGPGRFLVTAASNEDGHRPVSKTPSSRFSLDSVTSEDAGNKHLLKEPKDSKGSLMSVNTIKRLWRKTNNKMSVSGSSDASGTQSGRTSPNVASVPPTPQEPQASRPSSRTVSRSPQPGEYVHVEAHPQGLIQARPIQVIPGQPMVQRPRRKSSAFNLQWNQESPYPLHPPARSPPLDSSRQPSPRITPAPSPTPPSPQPPAAGPPADRSSGVRKSILKSWKSASGSLSVNSVSSSSTSRSSIDQSQDAPQKKRRPSILDGNSIKRGSLVSSTVTLVDIPPSPALPEEFANQPRSASRQSSKDSAADNRSSKGQRPSSRPVLSMSPPQNSSSLSMPPRTSGESTESRPSFDDSQFEIVSPKLEAYMLPSYPYHGLDQSMSSIE